MYYLADFARPLGSKDKEPRERKKNKVLADILKIGDKALYGTGAGLAGVSILPFRSKKLDTFLQHKRMSKVPIFGKPIREMALETLPKHPLGTRIAMNTPAYVTAGLLGAGLGTGYGVYKVIKNRRKKKTP